MIEITERCLVCHREVTIEVPEDGYERWQVGLQKIQHAMPSVSAEDRELLISGTCARCFARLFKET
jgi:hypothetical protein